MFTSIFVLTFSKKTVCIIFDIQFTLLAVFPKVQLKELRDTDVMVILDNLGKVEVLKRHNQN